MQAEARNIDCPYCGEPLEILIDCSVAEQSYVEDCQVCCSPMLLHVTVDHHGNIEGIRVEREND